MEWVIFGSILLFIFLIFFCKRSNMDKARIWLNSFQKDDTIILSENISEV